MKKFSKHRFLWIEARLSLGYKLNRADIDEMFSLGPATATRVIRIYRLLAPENIIFDGTEKCWLRAPTFKPRYFINALEGREEDYLIHMAVHYKYSNLNYDIS
jgi:hypothetical protein